ncbi:MAG: RagB/SusD family nutrient uptake outer membrane protein [Prevotella sp.]|nr:RagB/SusD family nutrient uptake outer membrane protein [Prevotella sp.]MBR2035994.1 RagB/SusD family nutrient uptake outer membrane protein [Prevotella sp.]MBR7171600.1 RagB/SusD family nutrient uptake outer membrane protein [Prevotella sp.]
MEARNIKKEILRSVRVAFGALCIVAASSAVTSCSDFFEQESKHVIYSDKDHLVGATDTMYSVIGIMNKMQAVADRTILLGEARGDLMDITEVTSSDLRDVALFNVGSENMYNQPRDYYAIINNCNYFIANADTALKNNRNEKIFMKEYAAVKAFRAWTYLQLALNYGSVPFVTEPILTKEAADRDYPRMDIKGVCDYFVRDLQGLGDIELPQYGLIRGVDSRLMNIPVYVILGDLNLWAGNYKDAAVNYYKYISTRNGMNGAYPIGQNYVMWAKNTTNWNSYSYTWTGQFTSENYDSNSELISMLPGDSIPSEGYYSQLRNIINSTEDNDFKPWLVASDRHWEISSTQRYCHITSSNDTIIVPLETPDYTSGDLRYRVSWLFNSWVMTNNERLPYQYSNKYETRNVHIYRRSMVYLRLAEALNRAGYPRFAYRILAGGVNNRVIEQEVVPYYGADSTFIRSFSFLNNQYVLRTPEGQSGENTMGIHDRGAGWSLYNPYYAMPVDTTLKVAAKYTVNGVEKDTMIVDQLSAEQIAYQIDKVEDMIVDEGALEFAYEGIRFYDLMRVALRRNDPAYLADRIYMRRGEENKDAMKSEIKKDLYTPANWYLDWNGKIGVK